MTQQGGQFLMSPRGLFRMSVDRGKLRFLSAGTENTVTIREFSIFLLICIAKTNDSPHDANSAAFHLPHELFVMNSKIRGHAVHRYLANDGLWPILLKNYFVPDLSQISGK
jgi:hypothetical protein